VILLQRIKFFQSYGALEIVSFTEIYFQSKMLKCPILAHFGS